MNRIDRLMGIMTVLQSRKYCTGEKLADKFGISIRTVYRDIKALSEIGIPVNFDVGKGYFIAQGYFLPPLSLTIEEANALILLNTLADKFTDNSIVKHSHNALIKLKAVLKYADKEKADELSSQINVYLAEDEKQQNAWLSAIQNAIIAKTVLQIEYSNNEGKHSKREIEPVGLIFYTNQWHLYAWCRDKKAYRDFKVKMIAHLLDTEKPHSIKKHQDLEDYVKIF
ncbi:MAG TPA: YafY family protein [Ferruginibacter sp.]|nr:YafY family protein [Ferruginibacter sp.]